MGNKEGVPTSTANDEIAISGSERDQTVSDSRGYIVAAFSETGSVGFETAQTFARSAGFRPLTARDSFRARTRERTIRRFNGVLLEDCGDTFVVALRDQKQTFEYSLPSAPFKKAGIRKENQPFEMDEYESQDSDGGYSIGYHYRALAKSTDGFNSDFRGALTVMAI